jgi:hypothetical protein
MHLNSQNPPDSAQLKKNILDQLEKKYSPSSRQGLARRVLLPFSAAAAVLVTALVYLVLIRSSDPEFILPNNAGWVNPSPGALVVKIDDYTFKLNHGSITARVDPAKLLHSGKKLVIQTNNAVITTDSSEIVSCQVSIDRETIVAVKVESGAIAVSSPVLAEKERIVRSNEIFYVTPVAINLAFGCTNGWYGQTREQRVQITNQGKRKINDAVLKIFLSHNSSFESGDLLIDIKRIPSLIQGESVIISYDISIPHTWPSKLVTVFTVVEEQGVFTSNVQVRPIGLTKIPYDVNGDGIMDIADVLLTVLSVTSTEGHMLWNPSADVNRDGVVNNDDVEEVRRHFGERKDELKLHFNPVSTSGAAPHEVTFSYHAHYFDGSLEVMIDFNGDGIWDHRAIAVSEIRHSVKHVFDKPGTFTARVFVKDQRGNTTESTVVIEVK